MFNNTIARLRRTMLIRSLSALRLLAAFFSAQGMATAGNLLYGLLCIRLLPGSEYAKFVVVFAFQGSLVVLTDLGISNSLTPLVGDGIDDLRMISDYLASLRQVVRLLFAISVPITIIALPLLVHNRHWTTNVVAIMTTVVLVSTWFARVGATYGAVLLLRRDRKHWYQTQVISSYGTLALLGVFVFFHWLNAFAAILINVSGVIWVAGDYYYRAGKLLGGWGQPSKDKRDEIVHLSLPLMPGVAFYGLQGQIGLFLITIFGRAAAVASLGALGRLTQVFSLLSQINGVFVEPYFARLPAGLLKANYLLTFVIAVICGGLVVFLGLFFPGLFLYILGPQYNHLSTEIVLVLISGAISFVAGVLATMNSARRFTYYSFGLFQIVLTLLVETVFIWRSDLGKIQTVLWFGIATAIPSLAVNASVGMFGFAKGGRAFARRTRLLK